MAGRFSFSVPERRNASDPWFRLGTLDVTTTMLVVLLGAASMVVWSLARSLWNNLVLAPFLVRDGEVWRVLTWPIANQPGLWDVITLGIFWYFGREIEGLLGRTRFAVMLLVLTIVPGLVAVVFDVTTFGLPAIQLAVFLVFIAEYPYARFFFGIPAWALGAVIVVIQVLQYIGLEENGRVVVLMASIVTAAITARSMGLAEGLPWIPRLPLPSAGGSRRKPRGQRRGGDVVSGPWANPSRATPPYSAPLPQPPRPVQDPHDQAELDHLLDKISANGMDGLSTDEKHRLNELSKRLRNQR